MLVVGEAQTPLQIGGPRHIKYLRLTSELCLILHGVITELYCSETSVRQNQAAYSRSLKRLARLSDKFNNNLALTVNTAPLLDLSLDAELEPLGFTTAMLQRAMEILIHRHTPVDNFRMDGLRRVIQTEGLDFRISVACSKNSLALMKSNVTLLCNHSHIVGTYASVIAAYVQLNGRFRSILLSFCPAWRY